MKSRPQGQICKCTTSNSQRQTCHARSALAYRQKLLVPSVTDAHHNSDTVPTNFGDKDTRDPIPRPSPSIAATPAQNSLV
jgi:hypothetical protein